MTASQRIQLSRAETPTAPGYYWAKWRIASDYTFEGDELTPCDYWEIVQVNVNDPGATDMLQPEALSVSVPGVREVQWPDCFVWGEFVAALNANAPEAEPTNA